MSCLFCDSWSHLSHFCDVFGSDESRTKILRAKNRCEYCLTKHDGYYHTTDSCYPQRRCYICFSRRHHSVYCPERFSVSPVYKPNIAKDLLARFSQMLNLTEKYDIAFAYPDIAEKQNLVPLKVISHLRIIEEYFEEKYYKPILVTDYINLSNNYPVDTIISYTSEHMIMKAKIINIENLKLDSDYFFGFISSKTTKLCCPGLELTSTVTFADILKKLSDIQELNFIRSNLDIGTSWPQELLQSENVRNLRGLKFTLKDIGFCAKSLAEFMIKNNGIFVVLYADSVDYGALQTHLSKYFAPPQSFNQKGSLLKVTLTSWPQFPFYLQFYRPITNFANKY